MAKVYRWRSPYAICVRGSFIGKGVVLHQGYFFATVLPVARCWLIAHQQSKLHHFHGVRYRQHKRNQTGVLAGVSDKQSYLNYKVVPLEERLAFYRQHGKVEQEVEIFATARLHGSLAKIWKYRDLAPYEARFEIALRLLPDFFVRQVLRRMK